MFGASGVMVYRSAGKSSTKELVTYSSPRSMSVVEYCASPNAKSCSTSSYRGPHWMKICAPMGCTSHHSRSCT